MVAAGSAEASRGLRPPAVVDLSVSFPVRNANTSRVACPSDAARYTVRGRLVAPSAALASAGPHGVTVYVHGFNFGGVSTFDFRALPAYDFAAKMAGLGQTSLVIDRLGFDSSGLPPGPKTCVGSAADVLHQIITAIRRGSYRLGGRRAPRFSRVVVAGHDLGGEIAEVEAYSYRDLNGLIVLDFADAGLTPTLAQWSVQGAADCSEGGKPARPGGPGGYFDLGPPTAQLKRLAFVNANPALVTRLVKYRRRNPCGDLGSALPGFSADMTHLGELKVPVLIAAGDRDVAFSSAGVLRQRAFFTGSKDVTLAILANTGHFPMFERTAPRFRGIVSAWLRRHTHVH
jgi:pimeloyl-ACP methyl ester carboxylesterase